MFTYRDITDEHVLDFAENARSHERAVSTEEHLQNCHLSR